MTQQQALAILASGKSVLLTGAAGTGKTFVLNKFIRSAKSKGKSVAITATTGLAATHLSGTTVHSWAGIGVHQELPKDFYKNLSKQRKDIILNTEILIIDEISMLHDYRLDMVNEVLQTIRQTSLPFGGIQVVLCGDFFQLPPINKEDSRQGGFITSSVVWQETDFTVCYLNEQYRQKDDLVYTEILNGIRSGFLSRNQLDLLKNRTGATLDPWVATTRLLTTNIDVDGINNKHLAELDGKSYEYTMVTSGGKTYVQSLLRSCLAPEVLVLKKGALVMCIKNSTDKKYVNGSLGIVEDFEAITNYPVVKLNNGKVITIKPDSWELIDGDKRRASATQLPLRLAWAITVHKSQGMTLSSAQIDLSKAFIEGMGYVALSRVGDINSLSLDGINGMALKVSPLAKNIDTELQSRSLDAVKTNQHIFDKYKEEQINDTKINEKQNNKISWADKLVKMRKEYPNAYKPWTDAEDKKLVKLFSDGKTINAISKKMGRHTGSIKVRIKKHFGEDIFD